MRQCGKVYKKAPQSISCFPPFFRFSQPVENTKKARTKTAYYKRSGYKLGLHVTAQNIFVQNIFENCILSQGSFALPIVAAHDVGVTMANNNHVLMILYEHLFFFIHFMWIYAKLCAMLWISRATSRPRTQGIVHKRRQLKLAFFRPPSPPLSVFVSFWLTPPPPM